MKWNDVDYYYICLKNLKYWEQVLRVQIADKSIMGYESILYDLQQVIHSLEVMLTRFGVDLKGGD